MSLERTRSDEISPDRKAHLLDVARGLWAQHSYHGLPLRRIADEAGVSLALIDHYFGAKHALFCTALEPMTSACARAARSMPTADAPPQIGDATDWLRALVDAPWLLSHDRRGRDLLSLWLIHRHERLPEVRVPLAQATAPLMVPAMALLQRRCPGASAQLLRMPGVVFAAAVDLFVGDGESRTAAVDADALVTALAAGLQVSGLRFTRAAA